MFRVGASSYMSGARLRGCEQRVLNHHGHVRVSCVDGSLEGGVAGRQSSPAVLGEHKGRDRQTAVKGEGRAGWREGPT